MIEMRNAISEVAQVRNELIKQIESVRIQFGNQIVLLNKRIDELEKALNNKSL